MSPIFQFNTVKSTEIVIDSSVPLFSGHMIKLRKPYSSKDPGDGTVNAFTDITGGCQEYENECNYLKSLLNIEGVYAVNVYQYQMVVRFGALFDKDEIMHDLGLILQNRWPDCVFQGVSWATPTNTAPEIYFTDFGHTYQQLVAIMAPKARPLIITGGLRYSSPRTVPMYIIDFVPSKIELCRRGWRIGPKGSTSTTYLFTCTSPVSITSDPHRARYSPEDGDSSTNQSQLEVHFATKQARFFPDILPYEDN